MMSQKPYQLVNLPYIDYATKEGQFRKHFIDAQTRQRWYNYFNSLAMFHPVNFVGQGVETIIDLIGENK